MTLYVENPKDSTKKEKKKPVRTNEFIKVVGYKVKAQKSVTFLYANIKQSEKKITKTISLITVSKRIK